MESFTKTTHTDTYPAIQTASHNGHSVLITGASRGIGLATAISFATAGASQIAIAARSNLDATESAILSAAQAANKTAPRILKLTFDVTDESSVVDAVAHLADAFDGKLDVLVNNAGYIEEWQRVAVTDPVAWWRSWEINLKGVYLLTRACLPLLAASASASASTSDGVSTGTVVNVSSIGAHMTAPGASGYQTAKFALLRFTEFVQAEYGDGEDGVVAIAVHPGGVATELGLTMPEAMHGFLVDTPQLAGDTLAWLTAEKRDWLGGRYVSVNWDMDELESRKGEVVEGDKLKMRMVY